MEKIDLEDVKIYMDLENKIIYLGDFENLTNKFVFIKNIMEKEKTIKEHCYYNQII